MSYTPTTWQTGDTITAEKLNNMESGIEASNGIIIPITVDATNERYYVPKEIAGDVYNQLVANPDAPVFLSFTSSSFAAPFLTTAAEKYESYLTDAYIVSFNPELWKTFASSFTQHTQNYTGATFGILKSAYESGHDWGGGLSSQSFVVTLTPTSQDFSGTMDRTVGQINNAYQAGQKIVFRVYSDATKYNDAEVTVVYKNESYTYPSFNAYLIVDAGSVGFDGIIFAHTEATDTGTKSTYTTTIYPLTHMS